jgi:hypothetical protein
MSKSSDADTDPYVFWPSGSGSYPIITDPQHCQQKVTEVITAYTIMAIARISGREVERGGDEIRAFSLGSVCNKYLS